ncbi:MAG: cytochrome-c oxidase, cbb3-type subunit III [Bradyrhizobiaceae bacterium]|nr:cytochrome-c oxidase, cbb3-type subunit III [Bradyrhizobiaceae bacterium]
MADNKHEQIDTVTGKATTGHVWDGVSELNTPLPRWWLWIFYATIVWSVGYWIVYPSWPLVTSYTEGAFGWKSRVAVTQELDALRTQRAAIVSKLEGATPKEIADSPELLALARAQGRVAFADNCAPCHGAGGGGAKGFPNLNDDDWIWGGTFEDIEQTIRFGVRSVHDESRQGSPMPAFGRDGLLKNEEIEAVADFVRSRAGLQVDAKADLALGARVFADNCAVCHGEDGKGKREVGAANIVDAIWLYSPDRATIIEGIRNGRGASMPNWVGRLDDVTIKALTVYVHSLGGGE